MLIYDIVNTRGAECGYGFGEGDVVGHEAVQLAKTLPLLANLEG